MTATDGGLPSANAPSTASPASDGPNPLRRRLPTRGQVVAGLALATLAFLLWFVPPVWRLLNGPLSVTRYDKKVGETRASVGPGLKGWISTAKISKHALHAVIAAEDGHFYEHHGFDFEAIRRSYETNLRRHKYARGGSTISQQVVKMAFLGREKTLLRKLREASGTVIMELILPKDKILEWYINLAEFGDGVYGISGGCWHYFKTKPEALTIEQSVHLALVLPSPNAWSRGLKQHSLTPFGQRRYAAILNTMRGMGFVTKTQWLTAITRGDFGRPIKGYAELVAADEGHKDLCPGSPGCPEADDASDEPDDGDDDLSPGKSTATAPPAHDTQAPSAAPPAAALPTAASAPLPQVAPTPTVRPSPPDAVGAQDTTAAPSPGSGDVQPAAASAPASAAPVRSPEGSGLPTNMNGGYE